MTVVILLIFILATIAWFFTIFNVIKTEFLNPNNKVPIMLMVIFMPLAGMIIYWVIRKGITRKSANPPPASTPPKPKQAPLRSLEEELLDDGWREMK